MIRFVYYPLAFMGGWVFNFVADIKFLSGFALGWFANSNVAPLVQPIIDFFR